MSGLEVHVAVVEWHRDDAEEPSVWVSTDWAYVARRAAEAVAGTDDEYDDLPTFRREGMFPVPSTQAGLEQWHAELSESTTVPWVTFYRREVHSPDPSAEQL
jgi:hypothetical protein